jgi:magnesium-transporting ATPase (P-type)
MSGHFSTAVLETTMSTEHSDAESPPRSSGLTSVEATRRLAEYGPNEPAPKRRLSAAVEIGRLFANPLVLILLVASAVSAWLGEDVDAGIIVAIVLLSVLIDFWQSYRSQQAADRLRASVAPTATVLRDGTLRRFRYDSWSLETSSGYRPVISCRRMHVCSPPRRWCSSSYVRWATHSRAGRVEH